MFERFTERAINVVSESQNLAKQMKCSEVTPEHLLLSLVHEAKGVSLKLFRMYGIDYDNLQKIVEKYVIKTSFDLLREGAGLTSASSSKSKGGHDGWHKRLVPYEMELQIPYSICSEISQTDFSMARRKEL